MRGCRPEGCRYGIPFDAILTEDAGLQERRHQRQHAPVSDPSTHPAHQGPVVDLIEAGRDVRVDHPLIRAAGEVVNLGDRVLGPAPGTEAVRVRREIRLEDRLQHELERSLDHPVPDGRDAQPATLATGLGDHPLPHRERPEGPGPKVRPQVGEERSSPRPARYVGRLAVDPRRARAPVAPHPAPCNLQDAGSSTRLKRSTNRRFRSWLPTGAAWPASAVPGVRLSGRRPGAPVFTGDLLPCSHHPARSLSAFALWPAFPASDYCADSAPLPSHQRTTRLPSATASHWGGRLDGSHVHHIPIDGGGAQLFPCRLAVGTPQSFPVASGKGYLADRSHHRYSTMRTAAASPDPPGFEPVVLA